MSAALSPSCPTPHHIGHTVHKASYMYPYMCLCVCVCMCMCECVCQEATSCVAPDALSVALTPYTTYRTQGWQVASWYLSAYLRTLKLAVALASASCHRLHHELHAIEERRGTCIRWLRVRQAHMTMSPASMSRGSSQLDTT